MLTDFSHKRIAFKYWDNVYPGHTVTAVVPPVFYAGRVKQETTPPAQTLACAGGVPVSIKKRERLFPGKQFLQLEGFVNVALHFQFP